MIEIKTYNNFEEVAKEVAAKHPIIYKYRTWQNDLHKRIITAHEVWFAHPHELNDTYDMRPPHEVIVDGIDWPEFRRKLEAMGRMHQGTATEQEFQAQVEHRFKIAQGDPQGYFHGNIKEYQNKRSNFDRIGVFSCCTAGDNEPMWAHYGDNLQGFAIGFDTEELARQLDCTAGYVHYDDSPIRFHPMENNSNADGHIIFQKSRRWNTEEEFRFSTAGIGIIKQRATTFTPQAVKEVLLGPQITKQAEQEIITAMAQYLPEVAIFKINRRTDGYGFAKENV